MIYYSAKTKSIILTYIFVSQLGMVVILPILMLLVPGLSKMNQMTISTEICFSIGLGLILYIIRNEIKEMMRIKKDWNKVLLYGIVGFLVVFLLQTILNPIITLFMGGTVANENEKMLTEMTQANGFFILVPIIIGPILEEIVFRYAILGSLIKRMKTSYAIILSSLLFGLIHFSLINLIVYVLLGVVFSLIYIRSKSLLAPMLAHILMNSMVMVLYLVGIN